MQEPREGKRPRHARPEVDYFAAAIEESFQLWPEVLEAQRRKLERKLEGLSPDERVKFFDRLERRDRRTDEVLKHLPWAAVALPMAATALTVVVQQLGEPRNRLIAGVVVIVLLGAAGLVLRGVGELRTSKVLKALGYFCGAVAYMVTAGVALLNAAQLLQL